MAQGKGVGHFITKKGSTTHQIGRKKSGKEGEKQQWTMCWRLTAKNRKDLFKGTALERGYDAVQRT